MTEESDTLLTAARKLAGRWSGEGRVRAIAVGGSVAAGTADRWSDIDLYLYWDPPPDPMPGDFTDEHEVRIDQTEIDGIPVEVSHFTLARVETMFEAVLVQCDADPGKQNLVSSVATGIALAGQEMLQAYRARAAHYPDRLAHNMVMRHLDFSASSYLRVLASRNDAIRLRDLLVHDARCAIGTLLGLNRVYQPHPRFKNMPMLYGMLPIAPPRLEERVGAMLASPSREAVASLEELVDDVLALLRIHMPHIDIGGAQSETLSI